MTLQEYRNQYKAPKSGFGEYAFSRKDWPGLLDWMGANKIKWGGTVDAAALFGLGMDRFNCLFLTEADTLCVWGNPRSLDELDYSLGHWRVWRDDPDILLHPSVLMSPEVDPPTELDF